MPCTLRRLSSLLCATLALATALTAQTTGRIVDASGTGIPFANLYAPSVSRGTVTDGEGNFSLALDKAQPADEIRISCIGFQDRRLSVVDFESAFAKTPSLVLAKAEYQLAEATVAAKALSYRRERTRGNDKRNDNVYVVYNAERRSKQGMEVGNLMEGNRRGWLQTIGVNLHEVSPDTVNFEVNIYNWQDGQAGERLHDQRIFWDIAAADVAVPVELDVRQFDIYTTGDYLVTLETLNPVDSGYVVKYSGRLFKRMTYERGADGEWIKFPIPVAIGMYSVLKEE